jgi:hypothetical protein
MFLTNSCAVRTCMFGDFLISKILHYEKSISCQGNLAEGDIS